MPTKFNIKKITGLPLTFTGQAGKIKFRVVRQLDIYGNINASIEDIESGNYIVSADGKISADNLADAFVKYVLKYDNTIDERDLKGRMKKFFTQINKDVKDEQKKGIKIKKAPIKKAPIKKAVPKKAAKKSKTKRAPSYQYGKSNLKRDQQRQALPPGKRKSASGRTYYEYRANRTDAGKLLGTKTHKDTKSHNVNIRVVSGAENYNDPIYILNEINYWQKQLDKSRAEYKSPQRKMYKLSIMQDIRLSKKWLDNNKLKLKKILSKIK
jgi:hypothetical protein